ncbi:MAG: aspartate carbamoyltransferase catalytic subunit [Chlorobi bacterium]|nr:aspartate carbamoyltransferase catalytic subunit [Chlorobiota bacterium]
MTSHALGIEQMGWQRCQQILALARAIRNRCHRLPTLDRSVALAFFEPSTRTRMSFELAACTLGCRVMTFSASGSSIEKGESTADTIRTLDAMGFDAIIIRHSASGAADYAARFVHTAAIINAGDGCHEHPTQALLDVLTLLDVLGSIEGRRVAIVGDLLHSRVFRSDIALLRMFGAQIGVCAPPLLMPHLLRDDIERLPDAASAMAWADAVIVLRLQRERMSSGLVPSFADYRRRYSIRYEHLDATRAIICHPGPVNADVELDAALIEHERSMIQRQVTNGVMVRMALLIETLAPDCVEQILSL